MSCLETDCDKATITPLMLYCSEHNAKYEGDYDYAADIARGSAIRRPGERPWEASRRRRAESAGVAPKEGS